MVAAGAACGQKGVVPFAAAHLLAPLGADLSRCQVATQRSLQHTSEYPSFCAAGLARRNTFYQTIYSALTASVNSPSGAASALRGEPLIVWALPSPAGSFRYCRRRIPGVQAVCTHVCHHAAGHLHFVGQLTPSLLHLGSVCCCLVCRCHVLEVGLCASQRQH